MRWRRRRGKDLGAALGGEGETRAWIEGKVQGEGVWRKETAAVGEKE